MKFITIAKFFIFIFSLVCQWLVFSQVISRTVNNLGLVLWILSLLLLYFSFPFRFKKETTSKRQSALSIIAKIDFSAVLIIFLALAIRIILMTNTHAFHNDEYISSYFSYSIGDISKLDWFGIYPIPKNWIWQFPLMYFFLQKVFFNIFGIGTIQMRLSILPYLVIIFTTLFLIVKRLYTKEAAYLSIAILAFFAPDLYLSRWSLHFFSSTAFFLLATYFFVLGIQVEKKAYFALFGLFLGFCYMTYYTSYIVFPLFFLYALTIVLTKQIKKSAKMGFLLAFIIFIFTLSPLLVYALKVDNFFMNRMSQVKLINGSWSPYQNIEINPKSIFPILSQQTSLSVRSLYKDEIGGGGGYNFGHLAFFNSATLIFFLVGIAHFIFISIKRKDSFSIFVLLTVSTTFLSGLVLAIPPPSFQRLTLIFPFIALIISVTVIDFYKFIAKRKEKIAFSFLVLVVLAVIVSNVVQFNKILAKDGPDDPDYPQILQYLEQQHQKMFYVAAFDTYGMGGILFIMSGGKINAVTHQLSEILTIVPRNETSFIVILYPDEKKVLELKAAFPKAVVINTYRTHMLLKTN
jgi:hypothetical protein